MSGKKGRVEKVDTSISELFFAILVGVRTSDFDKIPDEAKKETAKRVGELIDSIAEKYNCNPGDLGIWTAGSLLASFWERVKHKLRKRDVFKEAVGTLFIENKRVADDFCDEFFDKVNKQIQKELEERERDVV